MRFCGFCNLSYCGFMCVWLVTWYAICCHVSVKPAPSYSSPSMFSIQWAGPVVIWILRQVAGVFVCSYGPDNLVTLLSSGAGSPCSSEPPCVPPQVPEIQPPSAPSPLTAPPPAHRHFETAVDGRPLGCILEESPPVHLYSASHPLSCPPPPPPSANDSDKYSAGGCSAWML